MTNRSLPFVSFVTKICNTNIDLVNDNVFTKFGLILSIRSQDIEQTPNSDINQGP